MRHHEASAAPRRLALVPAGLLRPGHSKWIFALFAICAQIEPNVFIYQNRQCCTRKVFFFFFFFNR